MMPAKASRLGRPYHPRRSMRDNTKSEEEFHEQEHIVRAPREHHT
jgi:hypothetical protein